VLNGTLRIALLGSGAAIGLAAGPALAGEMDELKAQLDALQGRLDQLENQKPIAASVAAAAPANAVMGGDFPGSFKLPGSDTSFAIHGYTKLDFIYDFDQLLGDTFAISALTSGTSAKKRGGGFHATARQSRINFESRTPTDYGQLKTFIAGDFYGSTGGQINGNNSMGFRVYSAFGQLGPVLAGQTWTTFFDEADGPELLDFGGGAGTFGLRQPQVRFEQSWGKWTADASIENPGDITRPAPGGTGEVTTIGTITPGGTTSSRPAMPDLAARLGYTDDWGHVQVSGVLRKFDVDNGIVGGGRLTDDTIAGGGAVGGTLNLSALGIAGKDSVGALFYDGTGIGNYLIAPLQGVGQGTFAVFNSTGTSLRVITTAAYGGSFWVQHFWTDHLRSNATYGITRYNLPAKLAFSTANSQRQQTAYLNLIWSPIDAVNIGLEFMWGDRLEQKNPAGHTSDATGKRLQAALQYVF